MSTEHERSSTEHERIDAHHHVWDLSVRPQDWLTEPSLAPINRSFDLAQFHTAAAGINGSVLVETIDVAAETPEFLALAAADPAVLGVVGWVDLTSPKVEDDLGVLIDGPGGEFLVATRHQVQGEADPMWLCRDDVRRGLAAVGAAGLAFDLLVVPAQLEAAIQTVAALPDQRFVLAHAGKPAIRDSAIEPWASDVARLGALPNVSAKLSGLSTEADWHSWTEADFDPYVQHLLEVFGPSRLMWGSDWPVSTLAASYADLVRLAERWIAPLSDSDQASIWSGTAWDWYRLT